MVETIYNSLAGAAAGLHLKFASLGSPLSGFSIRTSSHVSGSYANTEPLYVSIVREGDGLKMRER